MSLPEVPAFFKTALLGAWTLVYIFLIWAVLKALRKTASGLLLGGGFALHAARAALILADFVLLRAAPFDAPGRVLLSTATGLLGLLAGLTCVAGVACLPFSLRRLRADQE
jgi:hypothetical protein